jgi:hypothetical protein
MLAFGNALVDKRRKGSVIALDGVVEERAHAAETTERRLSRNDLSDYDERVRSTVG